jgi:hypothetical protein
LCLVFTLQSKKPIKRVAKKRRATSAGLLSSSPSPLTLPYLLHLRKCSQPFFCPHPWTNCHTITSRHAVAAAGSFHLPTDRSKGYTISGLLTEGQEGQRAWGTGNFCSASGWRRASQVLTAGTEAGVTEPTTSGSPHHAWNPLWSCIYETAAPINTTEFCRGLKGHERGGWRRLLGWNLSRSADPRPQPQPQPNTP